MFVGSLGNIFNPDNLASSGHWFVENMNKLENVKTYKFARKLSAVTVISCYE